MAIGGCGEVLGGGVYSQAAQGGCGLFFSGDTPNPAGCLPVQPAVWSQFCRSGGGGVLDSIFSRDYFQPLQFCDSVMFHLSTFVCPAFCRWTWRLPWW